MSEPRRDFRVEPPRDIWEVADELADALSYLLDQHDPTRMHSPHLCSYCEAATFALLHLKNEKRNREVP